MNPNDEKPASVDSVDHHPTAPHTSLRSQSPVVDGRDRIERDRSSAESPSCPPTSSAQTPVQVDDSRVEVKDTEVESDRVFKKSLSKSGPEERTEDSLLASSDLDNEEPLNLEPHNPPLAESELNADEHEPESNANEEDLDFNADTYEPENPEKYDLTDEDLAFFDQPYIPSRN